eukprot:TRINITY_DN3128_c1_g1_i1.p2 TRINITY_DN3128_c1_g1~~TRINITY_DN3128_c1_g1_i1.p2  ORF type:complete len:128 (+),score=22.72 TRINITY_DN3128_c1_g1_i1:60-443(+)
MSPPPRKVILVRGDSAEQALYTTTGVPLATVAATGKRVSFARNPVAEVVQLGAHAALTAHPDAESSGSADSAGSTAPLRSCLHPVSRLPHHRKRQGRRGARCPPHMQAGGDAWDRHDGSDSRCCVIS